MKVTPTLTNSQLFDLSLYSDRKVLVAFRTVSIHAYAKPIVYSSDPSFSIPIFSVKVKSVRSDSSPRILSPDSTTSIAGHVRHLKVDRWYFDSQYTKEMWNQDVGTRIKHVLEKTKELQSLR